MERLAGQKIHNRESLARQMELISQARKLIYDVGRKNMKNTLVSLILLTAVSAFAEELRMPSSVRYEILSPQVYRFTISGLLPKGPPHGESTSQQDADKREYSSDGIDYEEILFLSISTNCTNFTTDLQAKTISFVLSNHLTNVVQVVNDLARWRKIPFWEELLMRDEQSVRGCAITYTLSNVSSNKPDVTGLEWKPIPRDTTFRVPFRYAKDTLGSLVFNRSAGLCIFGHNCFGLRICESSGKWFWEDTDNVYGNCLLAVCDMNEDGVDEILIDRNDHGVTSYLLYVPDFQPLNTPRIELPNSDGVIRGLVFQGNKVLIEFKLDVSTLICVRGSEYMEADPYRK